MSAAAVPGPVGITPRPVHHESRAHQPAKAAQPGTIDYMAPRPHNIPDYNPSDEIRLTWNWDPNRLLADPRLSPGLRMAARAAVSYAMGNRLLPKIHEAYREP